ncbi:TetR/AcrR family transcriptional regulator C-terminal domain-containing protein [Frankia tisae]|uniref:TetR/AcrR family transcriptional regulator C-terminal domain-containing protein n=1 Tax=Frankia tisae TaxID=2950104 RepID=UPI0021BEFB3F|nr:TetR/AcrR family transcriptional regulator C-terminal domain-containing protein [Frankia tisae]
MSTGDDRSATTGQGRQVRTVRPTSLVYVLGFAARELAEAQARRRSGLIGRQWQAGVAPYLHAAPDRGAHPHLSQQLSEAEDRTPDQRFEFGLGCVLAGVASRAAWITSWPWHSSACCGERLPVTRVDVDHPDPAAPRRTPGRSTTGAGPAVAPVSSAWRAPTGSPASTPAC